MNTTHPLVDVCVVGGGPVGLFAAFYAGMRGLSVRILERMPRLGGQCGSLYPDKLIYDIPGLPSVSGGDLARNLIQQTSQFEPHVVLGEEVSQIKILGDGGPFELVGAAGDVYPCRRVILAMGLGTFSPRRLPESVAEDNHECRGLYYFVKDLEVLRDRRVLVVGGGDSAVDWAVEAAERNARVTLAHRSDIFQAHEANLARLLHAGVDVLVFKELVAIKGNQHVEQACLKDLRDGTEVVVDIDAAVVAIGMLADLGLLQRTGLTMDGNGLAVDQHMESNIKGIFGAGDLVRYQGKMRLIAAGTAEAAQAANSAARGITPERTCLQNIPRHRYLGRKLTDLPNCNETKGRS
jgi:thioredoxin reductase (NADPH)